MPRAEQKLAADLSRWLEHPAAMVRELFGVEPDPWQEEVLEVFPNNWSGQGGGQRIAMPASKGPGKTAVDGVGDLEFPADAAGPEERGRCR